MSSLSLFVRIAPASNQFLQLALDGKKTAHRRWSLWNLDQTLPFALIVLRCGRGPD